MSDKTSRHAAQASISDDTAVGAMKQEIPASPKQRPGPWRRVAKYLAVPTVLLAAFVCWALMRTPPLQISKETTYLTEPLTKDGTQVDYFGAYEQEFYPLEMKTDANGYRLIVRELGYVAVNRAYNQWGDKTECDANAISAQIYEKLGLDSAIQPTKWHTPAMEILTDHVQREGTADELVYDLEHRLQEPWTLDDLPMMESWLDDNGPALDLIGRAVRQPEFCIPLVRLTPDAPLSDALFSNETHRMRVFARSLMARANYRIATGDIDGAIDDMITLKRLGRHFQRQVTVVDFLVGIAIERMADAIRIAANRELQPTEGQLRRIVNALSSCPPPADMDRMLLAERYRALDRLQSVALGQRSLGELLSFNRFGDDRPDIRPGSSVDWNVVMRKMNVAFDSPNRGNVSPPKQEESLNAAFRGERSNRVAEYLASTSLPANSGIWEAIRRTKSSDNLRRIALAMLLYEREHGTLPPACTVHANGAPLHSWRVLLLPFLGEAELFAKIRIDEPWDSAHNCQFHGMSPVVYQCPSAILGPSETTYSVVVGEHTAFQPGAGALLYDFWIHLILVVERRRPVCWMTPAAELTEQQASAGIRSRPKDVDGIGCQHPGGFIAALRNGSSQFVAETMNTPVLQTLLDGTAVDWPQ
jgi:hypothetical protein